MDKIAFVFSGQGDQFVGMGKELYDNFPAAKEIFECCERMRAGTLRQCFDGTNEELSETKNTQPCLFAMELAAAAVLTRMEIVPCAVAGFSLGEVAAATCAGLFDLETGFELVMERGRLMQREAEKIEASMAAVLKLPEPCVVELCSEFDGVYAVNFNCPGQVTVSGRAEVMPLFCARVKEAGGRAIPLKVKGGFHSPFMAEAAKDFARVLSKVKMNGGHIPLYSNLTAQTYGENVIELLSGQICSPVQWEKTIRAMRAEGIDTFIEIGPGKTLCNMIKKIDAEAEVFSVSEMQKIIAEGKQC